MSWGRLEEVEGRTGSLAGVIEQAIRREDERRVAEVTETPDGAEERSVEATNLPGDSDPSCVFLRDEDKLLRGWEITTLFQP